ncbi:MAG TPA: pyridoxamine 5'-phosphate oxidase family protein [Vicinamibacterales bacterium]|nr:pyridoxamine 5'-phosphate oxidase family protein [Vicinamibacterales bacterium]
MIVRLSEQEIDRLLHDRTLGHLGCSANGRPYVIPLSYVYEDGAIYGHTAEGLKLQIVRQNPEVCFQVEAIESPSSWRSAVVWGRFEILRGEAGATAMRRFLARLHPTLGHGPGAAEAGLEQLVALSLARGVAYRIVIHERSGRSES